MNVYTKQRWMAKQAREHPDRVFTSPRHLIDLDRMFEAWALTRKDGVAGIDGRTADDYETDLEADLRGLADRIKSGSCVAPPVRRHFIPKADGTKRPLGIPTFEDKVAQRAVVMPREPICEQDLSRTVHSASGQSGRPTMRSARCAMASWKSASDG